MARAVHHEKFSCFVVLKNGWARVFVDGFVGNSQHFVSYRSQKWSKHFLKHFWVSNLSQYLKRIRYFWRKNSVFKKFFRNP